MCKLHFLVSMEQMHHLHGAVMKNNSRPPLVHSEMYDFWNPPIFYFTQVRFSPVLILLHHLTEQHCAPELNKYKQKRQHLTENSGFQSQTIVRYTFA